MKKEININEDYVAESTIDIWSEDNKKPETIQYVLYKCFILEFKLESSKADQYHYVMNRLSFCNKDKEVTEDNIKDYFNNGILIDMYTSSAVVKYAVYEDGDWYISDTINKD